MANLNICAVVGNLTRDPELRDAGGTPVASLRVAVNSRQKQGDDWVEKPNYFDVTVFGGQANSVAEYLSKGRQVAVQGRLDYREWESPEGGKRNAVQIIASDVQFIGPKQEAPAEEPQDEEPSF